MKTLIELLDSIGIKMNYFLPGLLGGFTYAGLTKKSFWRGFFSAFVGAVTTSYISPVLSPIVIEKISWLSNNSVYGISFSIGLLSMNLTLILVDNTKSLSNILEGLQKIKHVIFSFFSGYAKH
ncbi:hypothetical protein [uncultured Tenacibaculum sp.]|uniref:hypothetical protein n=1 Tax=uncultured Tenacibaculum sp. TaxID=174713 RepID=UPI002623FFAF|nr:hypothetical protein [uncultured Tenacibaculum sp.]